MLIVVHRLVDGGIGGVVDVVLVVGLGEQQVVIGALGLVEAVRAEGIQAVLRQFILPCRGQQRVDVGERGHGGGIGATVAASQGDGECYY